LEESIKLIATANTAIMTTPPRTSHNGFFFMIFSLSFVYKSVIRSGKEHGQDKRDNAESTDEEN